MRAGDESLPREQVPTLACRPRRATPAVVEAGQVPSRFQKVGKIEPVH